MQNENSREIPEETFDLVELTSDDMSPNAQKAYIDKHWIILNDGTHALLSGGSVQMYDGATAKSTFFTRMSKELQHYYFKEKKDIKKVICDPSKPRITKAHLNLCKQMTAIRQPYKECSDKAKLGVEKLNAFVLKVLCKGKKDIFNHLIKMCAKMVRCEKNDACIYLKGPQGCGKSTFPEFLRTYVMGSDLAIETGSDPLRSQFNKELLSKIMVVFEELENFGPSEWIGISSKLKRWITSTVMRIEGKGDNAIIVENLITFWLLSNNDAIQDDDGRRYFILPISTEHMNDLVYFGDIRKVCFNKEVGNAYYNYLMEIDLTNFNSQNYPITQSKLDSVAKRLDSVYKFLKDKYILKNRGINKVLVADLLSQYVKYCNDYQLKAKNKIDFNTTLENVGLIRTKSNSITFYRFTIEELKAISDKFHWVHGLDEADNIDNTEDDETDESMFVDKAEYIRVEEHTKKMDEMQTKHEAGLISNINKLKKELNSDVDYYKNMLKDKDKYNYKNEWMQAKFTWMTNELDWHFEEQAKKAAGNKIEIAFNFKYGNNKKYEFTETNLKTVLQDINNNLSTTDHTYLQIENLHNTEKSSIFSISTYVNKSVDIGYIYDKIYRYIVNNDLFNNVPFVNDYDDIISLTTPGITLKNFYDEKKQAKKASTKVSKTKVDNLLDILDN